MNIVLRHHLVLFFALQLCAELCQANPQAEPESNKTSAAAIANRSVNQRHLFSSIAMSGDHRELHISTSDGARFQAPTLDGQDAFSAPQKSKDGKYVGWLAGFPGVGASYSQPLELIILDTNNRLHRFAGDFGAVYQWCYWPARNAVVVGYRFPHGSDTIEFALRRIDDEKLLGRYRLISSQRGMPNYADRLPDWVRCAVEPGE